MNSVGLVLQPGLVDAAGAADDGVEQPGVQASGLVTGQIDHDGDGPIDPDPRGRQLGRPGARWRHCCRSVSPGRPPNPPCDFHRNGLSTEGCCPYGDVVDGVHGVGMR